MVAVNPAKIDTLEERPEEAEMEVSPFVELLVARMHAHPKEFYQWEPNRTSLFVFGRIPGSLLLPSLARPK